MTRRAEPPVTPEQLALAYRQLRRPHWPDTLDAALAHATYGVCIRGLARNLARAPVCQPLRAPYRPQQTPAPQATTPSPAKAATPTSATATPAQRQQPPWARDRRWPFDARKAAANDLKD